MAWNDIDWANIQTGWQRSQLAERAQSEETVQNSVRNSAVINQQREHRREFDIQSEERKREFDARLPLIQYEIKSAQAEEADRKLFPILSRKILNKETTPEEAETFLNTIPARANLRSYAAQLSSVQARHNAQSALLKDEAEIINAYPEAMSALDQYPPFSRMRTAEIGMWKAKLEGKRRAELENLTDSDKVSVDGQTYLRNRKTGALHLVPKDYSGGAGAIDIKDATGNVVSQVIPKGIGARIPATKPTGPTMQEQLSRLNSLVRIEQKILDSVKDDPTAEGKAAAQTSRARLKELQDQIRGVGQTQVPNPIAAPASTTPAPTTPSAPAVPVLRFNPVNGEWE